MQYSPKLKKAAEEIKKILQEHDIAGIVVLHTPGNSEFVFRIDPSYSCCKYDEKNEGLRIRAKLQEDFKGDKVAHRKKLSDTANMLSLLSKTTGHMAMQLIQVSQIVDKLTEAEHFDGGNTSHSTQNN